MKYCTYCGKQIDDNAIFCGYCGGATNAGTAQSNDNQNQQSNQSYQNFQTYQTAQAPVVEEKREPSGLAKAANILLILGAVLTSIYTFGIGMAWCIPMVSSYKKKLKRGNKVSTKFKVCTILFVSTIAGILMLCDPDL